MTGADIVAISIAVLGLVLSTISLTWQVVQWKLAGSRVKVETRLAMGIGGQPLYDKLLMITARNVGRTAISLTGWGLLHADRDAHVPGHTMDVPFNPAMPVRLEPGTAQDFYMALEPTVRQLTEMGVLPAARLYGFVSLATGKRAADRKPAPLSG